tara:strand:- start:33 stop:899 length:867 start_codon:yes stop_codon:yes gene_type:complete
MTELFKVTLPTVMNVFAEGKQQTFYIKDRIPFVESQVTVNIPTPESILNALPVITTPDQFAEIQNKFIKLKENCKKVENLLVQLIEQIDKALGKLERVDQIFGTLNGFIGFISDFIPLLRTIIAVGQVGLLAQVFPIAQGAVTIRLGDAIKVAKGKLREIDSLARLIGPLSSFILKETATLRSILYPVRAKLNNILTEVRARCFYLDSVLIDKLKELELAMTQNPPTGGGIDGPNGTGVNVTTEELVTTYADQFAPEDILNNLENSNKQKFIEYLVENGFTGYQITRE